MRNAGVVLVVFALAACATAPAPTAPPASITLPPAATLKLEPELQKEREAQLAAARAAYEKNPNDPDALIWLGRRTAYLGRYVEAIDHFTEGIRRHPRDARFLRHRGHRWITARQLDRAIVDFEKAEQLTRGKPDQIEPDGLPNARNVPTSSLQSNVCYHLGLAHYLRGDFERALPVYQRCDKLSTNPDRLVSNRNWLYMTLRRLGRPAEAEALLEAINPSLDVIENQSYHKLLLMYRGEIAPEELLREAETSADAAMLYGIGNWYLYNGRPDAAAPVFKKIIDGGQWAAFAYIAAEADLGRMDALDKAAPPH